MTEQPVVAANTPRVEVETRDDVMINRYFGRFEVTSFERWVVPICTDQIRVQGKAWRLLSDLSRATLVDMATMDLASKLARDNAPFIKRSAICGSKKGVQQFNFERMVVKAQRSNVGVFQSEDEAMAWLLSDQ